MDVRRTQTLPQLDQLWGSLTDELFTIYDAHHVCVAAAQEIAAFFNVPSLVLLKGLSESYYDVWVCQPDRQIKQMRWEYDELLNTALTSSKPFLLNKGQQQTTWQLPPDDIQIVPFRPSIYNKEMPGGIGVVIREQQVIEIETLRLLAQYITTFIERALLRYRVTQQAIISDVVNDITISLTSTLSLEDIFDKVANPIRRIMNVESVSIGLVDASTGDLIFVEQLLGPLFEGLPVIRLKAGQGIAGWVAEHGESVVSNNVYEDDRFFRDADQQSGFQTNSIICVPLMVESQVIGILEALNKVIGRFDDTDLHLMQAIGSPLAIALENARLHAEVLAEKRRIEAIFTNMSEGMLTVDSGGRITGSNDSMLSLLQVDLERIVGRDIRKVIQAKMRDFAEFADEVLETDEEEAPHMACDVFVDYPSESVPVLVSGTPILDENNRLSEAIYVFSDLRQIREVERMRDDFFHNIVHELRTPLATILMYARLLRKGLSKNNPPEKNNRYLDVIERESDRLQMMVRQMLALAKLEAREIQRSTIQINLNHLFEEVLPPLEKSALEKGLHFEQRIDPELPIMLGDKEILYSIVKNLVENAIKFTLDGKVTVEAWQEDNVVFVEIKDEGIGIPQEAMPNMFKRFYRTHTAVEHGIAGTGLGLYMVKEGVEKHGGTIDVLSELSKGTTFIIRFPIKSS